MGPLSIALIDSEFCDLIEKPLDEVNDTRNDMTHRRLMAKKFAVIVRPGHH